MSLLCKSPTIFIITNITFIEKSNADDFCLFIIKLNLRKLNLR